MDLSLLIPILSVAIGIPGFVGFVAVIAGHTRKMKELEIRDRELELAGGDAALGPAIAALRDELDDTRTHVAEIQERLDFTEQLLAAREPSKKIVEADSAGGGP